MLLTFAFYTLVSTLLFEKGYGLFFYNVSTIIVIVMLSELGINISLQKLGNRQLPEPVLTGLLANTYYLKIALSMVILVLSFILNIISLNLLGVLIASIVTNISFNHVLTYYQIKRSEESYLNLVIIGNILRIIFLGVFYSFKVEDVELYILLFFLGQVFVLLYRINIWSKIIAPLQLKTLFEYILDDRFLHLITLVVALLVRLEFFIIGRSESEEVLETYSIYFTYTMFIPPLISAVNSTLFVRIKEFDSLLEYNKFGRDLIKILLPVMGLALVIISIFLFSWFNFNYIDFIRYTLIYLALLSTLLVKPWGLLLHYFNADRYLFSINLGQTIVAAFLGLYMLNQYGIDGLAVSFFVQQVSANILVYIKGKKLLKPFSE